MKVIVPALLVLFATLPACLADSESSENSGDSKPAAAPSGTTSKPSGAPTSKPAGTPAKAAFADVNGADAKALLTKDPSIVVLDIRTAKEYEAGHIKGAKLLDFMASDTFAKGLAELDKNTHYLVHCASGGRSGKSMAQFKELGFMKISHLADGFRGWQAAGHPVEK